MKRYLIAVIPSIMMCSCSSVSSDKEGQTVDTVVTVDSHAKSSNVSSDVKNCFKQWNADNPKRPDIDWREIDIEPGADYQKAYKEYIGKNYGENHSRTAIVRMYDSCPLLPDESPVNDEANSLMVIKTGGYTVYSLWRGPVVAQDGNTGLWFVVWDESYHYNTKYITSEADGLVKMEYIDAPDIDDNTDVIHYNLDTHKYYFAKEKYSGSNWQD